MFTGIVRTQGVWSRVETMGRTGDDLRVFIATTVPDLATTALGDSIAVMGVCLTAVDKNADGFAADVSVETLARTTLGELRPGQAVHLEWALRAGDPLGGHLVSGHVDGVATVTSVAPEARGWRIEIEVPAELARYVARKGSVTLDGISLTVGEVRGTRFDIHIVPHTWEVTILREYAPGRRVNLEVDLLARYLERLLDGRLERRE